MSLAALSAAACGSDDDEDATDTEGTEESGSEESSDESSESEESGSEESGSEESGEESAAPSGDPLRVMTVTTLNAAGPTYQNIANTAEVYAEYINARGGIAGRPLEVTVCDEQFDPAVATTCAPRSFAICTSKRPVPPAAAWIRQVSPERNGCVSDTR